MNTTAFFMSLLLLSAGVLVIASNSIGINCEKKDKTSTNYQFLVYGLITAICCVLLSFLGMFFGIKSA